MNSQEKPKHTSFIYIPPSTRRQSEEASTAKKEEIESLPMPPCNWFDIPSPSRDHVCPAPPKPKPSCSITITPPTISCPPIELPPSCPIQIALPQEIPAGSCRRYDTVERESNTISQTVEGKTTVLCSDGYEKRSKYVTRKDNKGMSHTYCKESETRSNLAKNNNCAADNSFRPVTAKPNDYKGKQMEETVKVRNADDHHDEGEVRKSHWEK